MKAPYLHLVVAMTLIAGVAQADSKKVLDLGEMEIDGELRRPSLSWLDSSKRAQALIPELYRKLFAELEAELTKPMTVAEYEARKKKLEVSDVGP